MLIFLLIYGLTVFTLTVTSCKTAKDIFEDIKPEIREIIKKIIDNLLARNDISLHELQRIEAPFIEDLEQEVVNQVFNDHHEYIISLIESRLSGQLVF